jgi:hypothetical protein
VPRPGGSQNALEILEAAEESAKLREEEKPKPALKRPRWFIFALHIEEQAEVSISEESGPIPSPYASSSRTTGKFVKPLYEELCRTGVIGKVVTAPFVANSR